MKKAIYSVVLVGVGLLTSIAMHSLADVGTPSSDRTLHQIIVSTQSVTESEHLVTLNGWGQIKPKEQTKIAAQVSGRVIQVHPHLNIGDIVYSGDVLFEIETADYQQNLIQAQADLALAQAELEEEIALGKVAEEEWKQISETPTKLALRLPQLASARAKVKGAGSKVANAELQLSRTKVYAPFDAIVQNKTLGLGQTIAVNETVVHLYRADVAQVNVPVSSFEFELLRKTLSQSEEFKIKPLTVEVHAIHNSQIFTKGELLRINKTQDSKTRMTNLVVQITHLYNKVYNPELQFGSFVRVEIPRMRLQNVYRVPQHLITNQNAWTVSAQNTLQKTPITIVWEDDSYSYISADLPKNAQFVTTVPDYAKAGTPLSIKNEAFAKVDSGAVQ